MPRARGRIECQQLLQSPISLSPAGDELQSPISLSPAGGGEIQREGAYADVDGAVASYLSGAPRESSSSKTP